MGRLVICLPICLLLAPRVPDLPQMPDHPPPPPAGTPQPIPEELGGDPVRFLEISLERDPFPQIYFPIDWRPPSSVAFVARAALPPGALLERLNRALREVAPAQPGYNLRTMDQVISSNLCVCNRRDTKHRLHVRLSQLLTSVIDFVARRLAAVDDRRHGEAVTCRAMVDRRVHRHGWRDDPLDENCFVLLERLDTG